MNTLDVKVKNLTFVISKEPSFDKLAPLYRLLHESYVSYKITRWPVMSSSNVFLHFDLIFKIKESISLELSEEILQLQIDIANKTDLPEDYYEEQQN